MEKPIKSPFVNQPKSNDRLTEQEINLLEIFKNEELLKCMRSVFWQDSLTDAQLAMITDNLTKDVITPLRKIFAPVLDWTEPIFGMASRWVDRRYSDLLTAEVRPLVLARQDAIVFMRNGIKRLEQVLETKIDTTLPLVIDVRMQRDYEAMSPEEAKRYAVASQDALMFVETGIVALQGYADRKSETDRLDKIKKDSLR